MADNISIVMTMKTDIDARMKSIASTTQGCSKAFEEFQRRTTELKGKLGALEKNYDFLKQKSAAAAAEAAKLKLEMSAMTKAARASGEELDTVSYEKLRREYQRLSGEAKDFKSAAQDVRKEIRLTEDEARKMTFAEAEAKTGSISDTGGLMSKLFGGDISKKLAKSGLLQMASNSISNAIGSVAESALDQPLATLGSSIISGVASGASAGAVTGIPGIGAAVGGFAGLVSGATQVLSSKDEAFKSYYRSLYEDANAATEDQISSGQTLAASRETAKLSFSALLGDDKQAADKLLGELGKMAGGTGLALDSLTETARTMLKAGTAADDVVPVLTKVEGAGLALGLADGDMGTAAALLGRMQTKEQASAGELEQLEQLGLDVFGWLAEELETDRDGVRKALSSDKLTGGETAEILLERMGTLYGAALEGQAASTAGLDSRLEWTKENIGAAGGEAYNELRSESKALDIAAYGGALGNKLKELSAVSGEVQAYGENLKDQFRREALSAVLLDELDESSTVFDKEQVEDLRNLRAEYEEAKEKWEKGDIEAGLKITDLRESAEAIAEVAYTSSKWGQKVIDSEIEQIAATRELTAAMVDATAAWRLNNEFTKGRGNTAVGDDWLREALEGSGDDYARMYGTGFGFGLDYVPYDGFPALLHEGERVLTAEAARRMDRGGGGVSVTVTGNAFHVRQASDIDEIAEALARKLRSAALRGGI